jgi:hypothetical protein
MIERMAEKDNSGYGEARLRNSSLSLHRTAPRRSGVERVIDGGTIPTVR